MQGKIIAVTGCSSGIGRAGAIQLAECGAKMLLIARREDALESLRQEVIQAGGIAEIYPCDLSDLEATAALGDRLIAEHGCVDVLINNAGRSIRRRIQDSYERMHDYQRCMQLNYFGAVQLSLKLLPAMEAKGRGHIINTSTWATLLSGVRFSAYSASKYALDGFGEAVDAELRGHGVAVTQLHFPIVRTDMIGPTSEYKRLPAMSPEAAGAWMVKAVQERPARIAHRLTMIGAFNSLGFPRISRRIARLTGI